MSAMPQLATSLPTAGIIANLSDSARTILESHGSFNVAPAETVLIKEGKPHGKLFCVISGCLEARRRQGEGHVLLGTIQPGEWLGEVDIFDPSSAMCSVVAKEPSQYWVITRERLEEFLNSNHEAGIILMIGLASTLGQRIRGITKKMVEQAGLARLAPQASQDDNINSGTIRSAAELAAAFLRQKDLR